MTSQPRTASRRHLVRWLAAAASALALLGPAPVGAQTLNPAHPDAVGALNQNPSSATVAIDTVINVRADRSAETVETRRTRILSVGAIQSESQQSVHYIEGLQTLDVEAYTEKPDGSKIPVDAANILTRDAASGLEAVYLRDAKVRTILFRDVAVGDTLVLNSRRVEKSGMLAEHYYNAMLFPLAAPFENSTVTVVAPKSIALNVGVYGEQLEHRVIEGATTTRHPRIIISTFATYEQLGRSYWSAVETKVMPTDEIAKLAEQITNGISNRRAQAEAIDHWIKQNIRYVGVYLGTGRIIANDPTTVLKNRYGDCKDHAVLMVAMLMAKGIAAEQVLVNLGNVYTLPETVAPRYFNHVIVYLPEFRLYDDPTASAASFGVLARATYDKPVLHVSAQGAHLAHIPSMRPAEHTKAKRTRIAVAADGGVTGETWYTVTGADAVEIRQIALQFQAQGLEKAAERSMQLFNNPGKGRYEIGSPLDGAPTYTIGGKFTLDTHLEVALGKAFAIPRGMDVLARGGRPGEVLLGQRLPNRHEPFVCSAGRESEDIEVSFADGLPLPMAPKGVAIDKPEFTYASTYRIDNRILKISRVYESRVTAQVCAPETEAAVSDPLKPVQADVGIILHIPQAGAGVEPPHADARLSSRDQCAGIDNAAADLRIGACTALIQSGRETQFPLAVIFVNRGLAYRMTGDNARARDDFDQAITLVSNYAVAFNWRGAARSSLHDNEGAMADFNEAIRLNPTFSGAFANRGALRWDTGGDRKAALADFDQATNLDPANVYAFQARGRAYRIIGEFDQALADFDHVIHLQKTNAVAWNDRCYTHMLAGALSAALADCDESLRLSPNFPAAFGNRAIVLLRKNDIDAAVADFDVALRLEPKYAAALYGRGIAKLRRGDHEGGNADMATATALNAGVAKEFAQFGLTT
jgi:tetratricopeptide (TPR) repeat protein